MHVVTCNPPFLKNYSRQSRSPCVAKSGTIYYAYYLAYAGVALEADGHKVSHVDCIIEGTDFQQSVNRIRDLAPSLILIDTSTPSIYSDLQFCEALKIALPDCFIAVVGTFPSKATDELFKLRKSVGFDAAIIGEYEQASAELAACLDTGGDFNTVLGLALPSKTAPNGYILTGERPLCSEEYLDSLPFVSEFYLRQFGEEGIRRHFYASINWPYIQILTARGCPFKCTFCNIPSIGSYRARSVESVVDEMKFIQTNMPFVKEVFIEDDTFPINKKRTVELCKKLVESKSTVTWSCNARVDTHRDSLEAMKEAGCRLVCVGFESPTKSGLVGVIKKTTVDQQFEFMDLAREVGVKVNGCFILGLPGDDRESIANTIAYSKSLMPNTAQFYPHMLYPGTGSFKWAEESGLLSHKRWDQWLTKEGYHNTPLNMPSLTSEDLLELTDYARFKFYTNPKYLIGMAVQSLKSPKELQRMLIAGKTFFPLLFKYIKKNLFPGAYR
ncbi:radical SAM protein [Polynucleobacter paneuropaeus]|nr:radical SAM protein [Polynucleobacter paneuropaeus]